MPGPPAAQKFGTTDIYAQRRASPHEGEIGMLQTWGLQRWISKTGLCLLMGSTACATTWAQDVGGYYSNRTALSGFVEYSNDSSHMLIGYADGRKISAVGASLERRSFLSNNLSGSWVAEVRPLMSVSDPTLKGFALQFPQQPAYSGIVEFQLADSGGYPGDQRPLECNSGDLEPVYAGTATYIGGTRSTYVSGFSPLGYKLSAFPPPGACSPS